MFCKLPTSPHPILATGGTYAWNRLTVNDRQLVDAYAERAVSATTSRIAIRTDFEQSQVASEEVTGMHVDFDEHAEASFDVPLATVGLATCSALAIQDPRLKSHYLAHVMASTKVPSLVRAIHAFYPDRHDELEIYVLPGELQGNRTTADWSLSNIYSALVFIGLAERARLLRPTDGQRYPSLLLHQGQLYDCTQSLLCGPEHARPLTTLLDD